MRALTGILIFLLVTSTLLAFYQWQDHQNISTESDHILIEEQVAIEERGDYLTIEHTINGLNGEEFEANIPQYIRDLSCVNDEGCEIEEGEALRVNNLNDLTITYEAPLKPLISSVEYNQDWLVNLQPIKILDVNKEITVSLSANKEGKWLSSIKPIISSERESIHYYEWLLQGKQNLPLYKVYKNLYLVAEIGDTGIYSFEPEELTGQANDDFIEYEQLVHDRLVIISDQLEPITLNQIVIVDKVDGLESELLKSHLQSITTSYSDDYNWMTSALANYFFAGEGGQIVEELNDHLTEEQKDNLFNLLVEHKKQVNETLPIYIDQLLSNILGYEVDFIKQNHQSNLFVPLFGVDSRTVYLNEEQVDLSVKLKNEEDNYVSLDDVIQIAELSGFKVDGRDEWFVQYENDRYRFYVNRNVYTINDQRYEVQLNTWFKYGNDVYVDISVIENLFDLSFTFSDEEIIVE
ncbi:hypothetical protein J2R98_000292 [Alkalibacillus filiformis]|uniref:Copper amine oxidase-like N-terminal domain-containing protein n=1 Tax=Alkalibacillus filiformis TaxID=200990 RepID=A0ABU0DPX5_9BACI|nr:hypothetical protein [Alkalibacillus filiformis]MDQ0350489.1 hypothetical protein [Alkalibacillus filiformis]